MATAVSILLTPVEPGFVNSFQLSSQAGFLLSQVVTLVIDNQVNPYPITVIHGLFNETVNVPANSSIIIPTFSNKSSFPINVAFGGVGLAPASNMQVNIIFMNYPRTPGSYGNTNQSSIVGTGQNTTVLASALVFPSGPGTSFPDITLTGQGNYILDSLDMAVEQLNSLVAGSCTADVMLIARGSFGDFIIQSARAFFVATASLPTGSAAAINLPSTRVWPQGLALPRASSLKVIFSGVTNASIAGIRINVTGVNTL